MKVKDGCTRKVFIIWKFAIKIPQLSYQWRHFLLGLLANMQEKHFSDMNDNRMCPVFFCCWGGWLLIMPRCKSLTEIQFNSLNINDFWEGYFKVPVENKICSFGYYKGKIVAIDYGS